MERYRMRNLIPSLALIAMLSVGMSLARPYLSNTDSYIYMNWNLFLGLLSLLFAWLFFKKTGGKIFSLVWFILWLGFLPNAPYILTDFIHIADVGPKEILWYDGLMLFGYALVGILSWLHSVNMVYQSISSKIFIPAVSLLSAFGIYLGRYVRFNTWDVFTKPGEILTTVFDTLRYPLEHEPLLMFTTVFWVFLMLIYLGYSNLHKLPKQKES